MLNTLIAVGHWHITDIILHLYRVEYGLLTSLLLIRIVICFTGVPVLAVLCNHLAHHSTGWQLKSWWLLCGTMLFNIFIASAVVMLILFVFLYFSVMRRLNMLSSKNSAGSKAIGRR
jgi:uncharacterized membrane protein